MTKLGVKSINLVADYFKNQKDVIAVYLFGSYLRGEAERDSDVDVAVLTDNKDFSFEKLSLDMGRKINRLVEAVDLKNCSVDFAFRVISEGEVIYAADEKNRILYEEQILRDYFDMKPSLEEYYKFLSIMAKKGKLHVRYI